MRHLIVGLLFFGLNACASVETKSVENYIENNAIEFDGNNLPDEAIDLIKSKKITLLGEGHGIENLPYLTNQIVKAVSKSQKIIVGLEFPTDTQNVVNEFINSKNGDITILKKAKFFVDSEYHSGRASKAMVLLLQELRKNRNVDVFCFDVPMSYSGNDRDTKMAENILNKVENTKQNFIALTGNIHSRLVPGVPWDPNYPTMGAEILRLSGKINEQNITNILFRYSEGAAWQCRQGQEGKIKCDSYAFGPSQSPYATEAPYNHYFLREENITEGHMNTLFIRKVSASPPNF